jgi:hypothetical protein
MVDKTNPPHRGMAMDTGIKVKATLTGFKPSTGGSAVAKSGASSKPATQSGGTTKTSNASKR